MCCEMDIHEIQVNMLEFALDLIEAEQMKENGLIPLINYAVWLPFHQITCLMT